MKLKLSDKNRELFIKTSIWNSIIEVFNEEKKISFEKYLISVTINHNIIYVKTKNPLINSELILLNKKIYDRFLNKIKNLDFKNPDFEIKYI